MNIKGTLQGVPAAYPVQVPGNKPKAVGAEVESKKQDLNVFVLIMDDVGIDKFQAFLPITGNPNQVIRIPNIKATVIDKGINFRRFWAMPICGPFRSGLETGLYGIHTGFFANINDNPAQIDGNFYLGCDPNDRDNHSIQWIQCLPSAIRRGRPHGLYKLGKFGKSHMQEKTGHNEWVTEGEGWDIFKGHAGNLLAHYSSWEKINSTREELETGEVTSDTSTEEKTNTQITEDQLTDIKAWLDTVGTRPFVCIWASNEGHEPYECPNPARVSTTSKNEWIAAFGGSYPTVGQLSAPAGTSDPTEIAKRVMMQKHQIEALDSCFAELVAHMQSNGQFDNTVFIVVGDNGTEASVVESPYDSNHYKRTTYAGGVRVPLWISGPVVGQYPRSSDEIINVVDLYQTILDICDVYPQGAAPDLTKQHSLDSITLLPHIKDPSVPHPRAYNFALRGGPYCGYGYDPSRKLYVSNPANSAWSIANKDYFLIRFGGSSITEKMWASNDYLQEEKDNLLATMPNDPAVQAARAQLSAQLNVILNT